jgi:hypothetical protein
MRQEPVKRDYEAEMQWDVDQGEGVRGEFNESDNDGTGGQMPLINVAMVIIVVGVLLWLANRFIPMEATVKSILNAVVIVALVLWILALFFNVGSLGAIRIGR